MMEDHEFCDSCPGCRPAMMNLLTGLPLPDDHPRMIVVNRIWDDETTFAQRRAYVEVTLKNSIRPGDLQLFAEVAKMIAQGLRAATM